MESGVGENKNLHARRVRKKKPRKEEVKENKFLQSELHRRVTVHLEIDVSFLYVCPVIDHNFRCNIVKMAVDPHTTLTMS